VVLPKTNTGLPGPPPNTPPAISGLPKMGPGPGPSVPGEPDPEKLVELFTAYTSGQISRDDLLQQLHDFSTGEGGILKLLEGMQTQPGRQTGEVPAAGSTPKQAAPLDQRHQRISQLLQQFGLKPDDAALMSTELNPLHSDDDPAEEGPPSDPGFEERFEEAFGERPVFEPSPRADDPPTEEKDDLTIPETEEPDPIPPSPPFDGGDDNADLSRLLAQLLSRIGPSEEQEEDVTQPPSKGVTRGAGGRGGADTMADRIDAFERTKRKGSPFARQDPKARAGREQREATELDERGQPTPEADFVITQLQGIEGVYPDQAAFVSAYLDALVADFGYTKASDITELKTLNIPNAALIYKNFAAGQPIQETFVDEGLALDKAGLELERERIGIERDRLALQEQQADTARDRLMADLFGKLDGAETIAGKEFALTEQLAKAEVLGRIVIDGVEQDTVAMRRWAWEQDVEAARVKEEARRFDLEQKMDQLAIDAAKARDEFNRNIQEGLLQNAVQARKDALLIASQETALKRDILRTSTLLALANPAVMLFAKRFGLIDSLEAALGMELNLPDPPRMLGSGVFPSAALLSSATSTDRQLMLAEAAADSNQTIQDVLAEVMRQRPGGGQISQSFTSSIR